MEALGRAVKAILDLHDPTGSLTKDIRNQTILCAVGFTVGTVANLAEAYFEGGSERLIERAPPLITIGARMTAGAAMVNISLELTKVVVSKAKERYPIVQAASDQLHERVIVPLGRMCRMVFS